MNTGTTWRIASASSDATLGLGERLGQVCKGGEVFELVSDLGGGKTTFTKGLAKGIGSTDHTGSPTFTISREYQGRGDLRIYHFDFYRLTDPGIVALELRELLEDSHAIIVIEWGSSLASILPDNRIRVEFKRTGEEEREIFVSIPAQLRELASVAQAYGKVQEK